MKKLMLVLVLVALSGCNSNDYISPSDWNFSTELCETNGGIKHITADRWMPYGHLITTEVAVYCNNGAEFGFVYNEKNPQPKVKK